MRERSRYRKSIRSLINFAHEFFRDLSWKPRCVIEMRKIGDVVSQSSFGIGLDNLTCLKSFLVCFFLLRSHLNLLWWMVAFSIFSGCGLGFLSLGLAFPIYV